MHPSREELQNFVENNLPDSKEAEEMAKHIKECEFCAEFCDNYRTYMEALASASSEEIPVKALKLARRLYSEALREQVVQLRAFEKQPPQSFYLAADGAEEAPPDVINLASLYSDDPEFVLRAMRDLKKGYDYLQLIADVPHSASHVLLQIPELGKEFATDDNGRVILDSPLPGDLSQFKWQIKMPDAMFSLKPLVYDPEEVEYRKEMELETERNDRIRITFEGKAKGKQISVRVLELEGKTDFEKVRIYISQKGSGQIKGAEPGKDILFDELKPDTEINIRLFT